MKTPSLPSPFRSSRWIVALPLLLGGFLSDARGTTGYWRSDATNGNFRDTRNWQYQNVPGGIVDLPGSATGDVAYFDKVSTQSAILLPTVPDTQRHIVGRFIFQAGSGAYTFSGGLVRIDSSSVGGQPVAGIYIESGVTTAQTFLNPLEFVGGNPYLSNQSTVSSATLNFSNIQAVNKDTTTGTTNLHLQGVNPGNNTISGVISSGPGRVLNLDKSGAGVWVLSGTNTYAGTTTVTGGTLVIGGAGSINATSSVTLDGATAVFRYESTTGLTRDVAFTSAGGTFLYNSAARYGGGALNANSGTKTVGGSGVIGALTVGNGGALTPGALGDGSIGTLTLDSLSLGTGASTRFDIASGLSHDSVLSLGAVEFGGTLTLSVSSLLDSGERLTLFDASTYTGNFDAIAISGAYDGVFTEVDGFFRFTDGTNPALTFDHQTGQLVVAAAVPEPSSFLLMGVGLGFLVGCRVRGRRWMPAFRGSTSGLP